MDNTSIRIVAKHRIKKFEEEQNPEVDTPFEVVEREEVLVGDAAVNYIKKLLGGELNATN